MNTWMLTEDALREPWRLITCHLAHPDWRHAADDGLALIVPFLLVDAQDRKRLALWLLGIAPLLSLALMPFLDGGSHGGLAGLACAAWAFVGIRLAEREETFGFGAGMVGLLSLKFMVEAMTGCGILMHGGRWQSLTEAHWIGTLLGLCAALIAGELRQKQSSPKAIRRTRLGVVR